MTLSGISFSGKLDRQMLKRLPVFILTPTVLCTREQEGDQENLNEAYTRFY